MSDFYYGHLRKTKGFRLILPPGLSTTDAKTIKTKPKPTLVNNNFDSAK